MQVHKRKRSATESPRAVRTATVLLMLFALCFAMTTHAEELSLDAAKESAATGGKATLLSYAAALRFGWLYSLLLLQAGQLEDPRTYSQAAMEKEPLTKHIRCVEKLQSQDLVTKALTMNPSRSDLSSKVTTFSSALALTINDLCPIPSLEINSGQPQR